MRKLLVPLGVALASLAALAGGVWAWLRRRTKEPVAELPPAGGTSSTDEAVAAEPVAEPAAEPAGETAYERELEAETAERRAAAERLKNDPLTERLSADAEAD